MKFRAIIRNDSVIKKFAKILINFAEMSKYIVVNLKKTRVNLSCYTH